MANNDPKINIPGWGVLPLSKLKAVIKARIKELSQKADGEQWNNVYADFKSSSVLQLLIKSLREAEADLSRIPKKSKQQLKEQWLDNNDVL